MNFSPAERFLVLKRWEMRFGEFESRRAIFGSETLRNAIWSKRPPHGLKSTFCTLFMESLLFSRIGVNFSPAWRFLVLKRWEMRFGLNVHRMAWKARLVQFSYNAYCFHVLALISVPWAIFGSVTLENAIWSKGPPHRPKSTFSTMFIQSLLLWRIGVNFSPLSEIWIWNVEKCDFVKKSSVLRMAWKQRLVQISLKAYCFHVLA